MKPFNITQTFIDSKISLQKPMVRVALETLDLQTLNEDDIKLKIESYKKELEQFCTYNNALIKHFQEPFNYAKSFSYNDFYLLLGVEFIENICAINLVLKKTQNSNNFKTFLDENLSTTRRVSQICLETFEKYDASIQDKFNEYTQLLNETCTLVAYNIDLNEKSIEYEDFLGSHAKIIHLYDYKPYQLCLCYCNPMRDYYKIILNVVHQELPFVTKELLEYFETSQKTSYSIDFKKSYEQKVRKDLESLLGKQESDFFKYKKSTIHKSYYSSLQFHKSVAYQRVKITNDMLQELQQELLTSKKRIASKYLEYGNGSSRNNHIQERFDEYIMDLKELGKPVTQEEYNSLADFIQMKADFKHQNLVQDTKNNDFYFTIGIDSFYDDETYSSGLEIVMIYDFKKSEATIQKEFNENKVEILKILDDFISSKTTHEEVSLFKSGLYEDSIDWDNGQGLQDKYNAYKEVLKTICNSVIVEDIDAREYIPVNYNLKGLEIDAHLLTVFEYKSCRLSVCLNANEVFLCLTNENVTEISIQNSGELQFLGETYKLTRNMGFIRLKNGKVKSYMDYYNSFNDHVFNSLNYKLILKIKEFKSTIFINNSKKLDAFLHQVFQNITTVEMSQNLSKAHHTLFDKNLKQEYIKQQRQVDNQFAAINFNHYRNWREKEFIKKYPCTSFQIKSISLLELKTENIQLLEDSELMIPYKLNAIVTDDEGNEEEFYLASKCKLTFDYSKIEQFKEKLKKNPKDANAWNDFGNLYLKYNELGLAIESYEKAIAIDDKHKDAWYNIGIAFGNNNQIKKSIDAYETAIKINPKDAEAFNNLADTLLKQGHRKQAKNYFNKAIEINPKFTTALKNMGDFYLHEKDIQQAKKYYLLALKYAKDQTSFLEKLKNELEESNFSKDIPKDFIKQLNKDKENTNE